MTQVSSSDLFLFRSSSLSLISLPGGFQLSSRAQKFSIFAGSLTPELSWSVSSSILNFESSCFCLGTIGQTLGKFLEFQGAWRFIWAVPFVTWVFLHINRQFCFATPCLCSMASTALTNRYRMERYRVLRSFYLLGALCSGHLWRRTAMALRWEVLMIWARWSADMSDLTMGINNSVQQSSYSCTLGWYIDCKLLPKSFSLNDSVLRTRRQPHIQQIITCFNEIIVA